MDPNETLRQLRSAVDDFYAAAAGDSGDAEFVAAYALADALSALDDWLSRGGNLPSDWKQR